MRLLLRAVLVLCALTLALGARGAAAQKQDVSALRSAYLFYFSHFIDWPTAYVFENKQFNLCVQTSSESDLFQLSTLQGKKTGTNTLNIVDVKNIENRAGYIRCHMLYLGEGENEEIFELDKLISKFTLIITEGDNAGGDIHLFNQSNKLKFEINKAYLDRKNFTVSSKLMRLSQRADR